MENQHSNKQNCSQCNSFHKSIFCRLEQKILNEIDSKKLSLNFSKGEILFQQGELVRGMYCIQSGKAKEKTTDAAGHEIITKILGPGDTIGIKSLLSSTGYLATVEFIDDSTVCIIDKLKFDEILKKDSRILLNISQKLAEEITESDQKNLSFVHHTVKQRTCSLLLHFVNKYGVKSDNGVELDIKLTREEMASLVGTTPETMIRTISQLKNEKILSQNGKKLVISNVSLLNNASGIF